MKNSQKYELTVVFTDRHGTQYECFIPLLGPRSFISYEYSTSRTEVPFEVWVSNRLSKWLRSSYVTVGDVSVSVNLLRDFEFAPFSSVNSYHDVVQLGCRVLSLIMCQIF